MKISNSQQPIRDPELSTDDNGVAGVTPDDIRDEPSAFSQVLVKKKETKEEPDASKGRGREKADALAAAKLENLATSDQPSPIAPLESKRAVAVPPEIQNLVREISVVIDTAGKQQVQIELNSNVLQGLHIRIERQNQGITVQFQTSSDEISRLISKNAEVLGQSLANRGISVADIHVTGPRELRRRESYREQAASRQFQGRGQRGSR
jgi:flagellar hook-length control protein FliK